MNVQVLWLMNCSNDLGDLGVQEAQSHHQGFPTLNQQRFLEKNATTIFSKKLMPKPPFVFNGSLLTECWKVRPVFCRHPFKGSRMLSSFFSGEWSWPGDPGTAPILLLVWPAMVPVWEASMAILNHPKITGRDVCLTNWLNKQKSAKFEQIPHSNESRRV